MDSREKALVRRIRLITGRKIDTLFSGEYHSAFRGTGLSFDSVREYQSGDDVRTIDWNVSSRLNHLYVRQYIEERELSIVIAIDVSASTLFGSSRSKADAITDVAALFLYLAERNRDSVSVLLFSDRVERFIRPARGRRVMLRVLDEILNLRPEGRRTDLTVALDFMGRVLKKRSIVFLLSDFMDAGDYGLRLKILGRRHDIVPVMVYDPLEKISPVNGLSEYRDMETGRVYVSDGRPLPGNVSPLNGFDSIVINTGESVVKPVLSFFEKRNRSRLPGIKGRA